MIWLARSSARRRRRRRRRYEWRACRDRPLARNGAWWCGDRRVKQLVISVLCWLPAARAAVAHAELVALGVGHDYPPAAVLGPAMSVKTARRSPSRRSTSVSTSGVSMPMCMRFLVSLASPTRCKRNLGDAPDGDASRTYAPAAPSRCSPSACSQKRPRASGPRSQGPARSSLQPRADPPTTLNAPPAGHRHDCGPCCAARSNLTPFAGQEAPGRIGAGECLGQCVITVDDPDRGEVKRPARLRAACCVLVASGIGPAAG
jgi:hypothetical protein